MRSTKIVTYIFSGIKIRLFVRRKNVGRHDGRWWPNIFSTQDRVTAKKKARIEIQPVLNPISYEKPNREIQMTCQFLCGQFRVWDTVGYAFENMMGASGVYDLIPVPGRIFSTVE